MSQNIPLYAQLKEFIIQQIRADVWQVGDQLPSQRVLAEQHAMSHMTVRRAINELLSEGVLASVPGKGIYVTNFEKEEAESGAFVSFTNDMKSRGLSVTTEVLAFEVVHASTALASVFEKSVGFPLFLLRRVRFANDKPTVIQTAYLPRGRFPGLETYDFAVRSLYEVLQEDYNIMFAHGETSVQAAIADEEQAALLQLEFPSPVLITEQITRDIDNRVIEFVRSTYSGNRFKMQMQQHKLVTV